jgi:transposase
MIIFPFFCLQVVFLHVVPCMSTKHGSLSSQAAKRLLGGELILKGYDNTTIADIVGVTTRTVSNWRCALNAHNDKLYALARKPGSGRIPRLNDEQKQQLKNIILDGAVNAGYPCERWTSKIVANFIQKQFDVKLAPRTVRDLLPTLGLSPQMPVVKSHKYDENAVKKWARYTWSRLKKKQKNSASH